ncbi:MAG: response regulator [Haloferacaceae archaeon]|jgi:DNA-binding response OmpR family regulator
MGDEPEPAAVERGTEAAEPATVLVVDDDPDVTALYAEWLADDYDVRVAHDGRRALAVLDEVPVDVALLDRRMDDVSGDEVLAAIRSRGHDCRVAMVTAVEPDFDLVDVPFDDYLGKPVSRTELRATVAGLVALEEYAALHLELSSKRVRRSVLRGEKRRVELEESEAFERLNDEIERLEERLADIERDHPEYVSAFEQIK